MVLPPRPGGYAAVRANKSFAAMDKLIAQEEAEAGAATAASAAAKVVRVSKDAKVQGAKRKAVAAAAPEPVHETEEDWDEFEDDEDDEDDEELNENGYFVPPNVTDPPSADAAEAFFDRRVFLDGVPGRADLRMSTATIVGWRAKKQQWEIECDRGDEPLLVSSKYMFFNDVPQEVAKPKKKPAVAKAKKLAPGASKKAKAAPAKKKRV